jgi:hypothetical protein
MPPRMYAVIVGSGRVRRDDETTQAWNAGPWTISTGELVMVEVPPNCTIHDADAERLERILSLAYQIGQQWRDQDGINPGMLDQLAMYTMPKERDE